jgi:hypothetical protein
MTESLTRQDQGGAGNAIADQRVGSAVVLHLTGPISAEAQHLALNVPQDDANDIVVLDLPAGVPFGLWQTLADAWPRRRRRGLRLVPTSAADGTAPLVAHWLAQRLRCTVYAPDGPLTHTAAGHLFVRSGVDGGWLRFVPGKPAVPAGRRYPTPPWDAAVTVNRELRDSVGAEPLPGGVWIRDGRDEALLDRHRDLLTTASPCDPDTITVVLGCPGGPAVTPDDVVRFRATLTDGDRLRLRFAGYGPVDLPGDDSLGQALADALDVNVVCYAGLPLTSPYLDATYTVRADGTTGWPTFTRELGFAPRVLPISLPRKPVVLSHRTPPGLSEEIEPQTYRYDADVTVEVVEAGLWVRTPQEPADADMVRAIVPDPERCAVIVDDREPAAEAPLREAAVRLAERLSAVDVRCDVRGASELVRTPPDTLFHQPAEPPEPERRWNEPTPLPTKPSASAAPPRAPAAPVAAPPVSAPRVADDAEFAPAAPVEAPPVPVPPAPPATAEAPVPAPPVSAPPVSAPPVPDDALTARVEVQAVPAPPAPAVPDGAPVEALPVAVVAVNAPAGPPAGPVPDPPAPGHHPAQAPAPAADPPPPPLPQPDGVNNRAAWLHRAVAHVDPAADLAALADDIAPAVAGRGEDLLVDATALRWYLSRNGARVDGGLRRGTDGPHVGLAEYVEAALARMPMYRGATVFSLSVSPRHWQMYGTREVIADWGFLHALVAPCAAQAGDTDVLLWSLTGRRTDPCEPGGDEGVRGRVLFLPGTVFKLLELRPPGANLRRGHVVLRELAADEVTADGAVDPRHVARDGEIIHAVRRTRLAWSRSAPRRRVGPAAAGRFDHLPGLV